MKKLFIILFFVPSFVYSQISYKEDRKTITKFYFSIAPTFVIPIGNLNNVYQNGYGGIITFSKKMSENAELFIEGGYLSFKGKSISMTKLSPKSFNFPNMQHIPLIIGGKFINEKFNFALGFGVGKYWIKDIDPSYGYMINPSIGYDIGPIIVGVNYSLTTLNNGNSNNYLGLKFSIKFQNITTL